MSPIHHPLNHLPNPLTSSRYFVNPDLTSVSNHSPTTLPSRTVRSQLLAHAPSSLSLSAVIASQHTTTVWPCGSTILNSILNMLMSAVLSINIHGFGSAVIGSGGRTAI